MYRFIASILVALITLQATWVCADPMFENGSELRLVRAIYVYLKPRVQGACPAQPDVLKTEAELVLRRSGVRVAERFDEVNSPGVFLLEIDVVGVGFNDQCLAKMEVSLTRVVAMPEGHVSLALSYKNDYMGLRSAFDIQQDMRAQVSQFITDLANRILKLRSP